MRLIFIKENEIFQSIKLNRLIKNYIHYPLHKEFFSKFLLLMPWGLVEEPKTFH